MNAAKYVHYLYINRVVSDHVLQFKAVADSKRDFF